MGILMLEGASAFVYDRDVRTPLSLAYLTPTSSTIRRRVTNEIFRYIDCTTYLLALGEVLLYVPLAELYGVCPDKYAKNALWYATIAGGEASLSKGLASGEHKQEKQVVTGSPVMRMPYVLVAATLDYGA